MINTLLHRPDLFNAYVSLDGALWWNNQRVVAEAKLILAKERFKGKALFIALANRMEKGMDTLAVQKIPQRVLNLSAATLNSLNILQTTKTINYVSVIVTMKMMITAPYA